MMYGCLLSIQHNNQEIQSSVNSLSLSLWSVFKKGLAEQPQLFLFCLEFPPSWKTQLAECKCYIHQRHLQTMLGGRGSGPWSFESAVGWGEGRWWDQKNVAESFRPSHWRSRRTGGSGVSARCQMTPCCHLVRVA